MVRADAGLVGMVVALVIVTSACGGGERQPTREAGQEGRAVDSEAWDYVALGDSFTSSASWPELLASSLEEDLGVTVRLHNEAAPGQTASAALARIRTDQGLRRLVGRAELITVNLGVNSLEIPLRAYQRGGDCGGADNQDCLGQAFADVKADWTRFVDELVSLRGPDEASLVTFRFAAWLAEAVCGWGNECWEIESRYWLDLADFVQQTATAAGVAVVDLNRVFNGPDSRRPVDQRLVLSDGVHVSDEGSAVISDLLRGSLHLESRRAR